MHPKVIDHQPVDGRRLRSRPKKRWRDNLIINGSESTPREDIRGGLYTAVGSSRLKEKFMAQGNSDVMYAFLTHCSRNSEKKFRCDWREEAIPCCEIKIQANDDDYDMTYKHLKNSIQFDLHTTFTVYRPRSFPGSILTVGESFHKSRENFYHAYLFS